MKLSKKAKIGLFILLILLNLILRYPVIYHEIGGDSLEIHSLANSLSIFGEASWWVHPLGIIGMYPSTYASAVPFLLSGVSQCTGLDVELVIFIYGLIFGLFSIFAGYIVAGEIYNNDLFKFLVAFGFSVSPGILAYTTWTAPARSPFIIILPLFLYALLKSRKHHLRYGLITVILALLLLATHHLAFYLIPVFAVCFLVTIVYELKEHIGVIKRVIKRSESLMPLIILSAFCLMFAYPFMTHKFMVGGSRWDYSVYKEYARYTGILVFLAIGGFAYLVFKQNKRYEEWSLLSMLLVLTVFIQQQMYMKWFILIFAFLLAGIGLLNLFKLFEKKNKKGIAIILIIFLLLSVFVGSFFQYWRPSGRMMDYIEDDTFATGLWFKENINGSSVPSSESEMVGFRIGAISGKPVFSGVSSVAQAYGFVDSNKEFTLKKLPITSEEFWMCSPYKRVAGSDARGYYNDLMKREYNSPRGSELVSKFNLSYVIGISEGGGSKFLNSIIYDEKEVIYDCGRINVWCLN